MSTKQHLRDFVDAVIKKDDVAAKSAWETYSTLKAKEVLKEKEESPIKLKGEDLFVNGKAVGKVKHDVDDDKGIQYTAAGGKAKKFDDLKSLYAHVGEEHKLNEVKDFESEIQKLPNRDETEENIDGFEDGKDGEAKKTDGPAKAKAKKIIDNVKAGKKA
jgi:hypothetical protein